MMARTATADRVQPSSPVECPVSYCRRPAGLCCVNERGAVRRAGLHPERVADARVFECPHPADMRGHKVERGTFDYHYQTCKACGGIRPEHDDDDGCRTCIDFDNGDGPGHKWIPED